MEEADVEPVSQTQHLSLNSDSDLRETGHIDSSLTNSDNEGSGMEEIKFVLNGKEEKFVIARHVDANVDRFSDQDDYEFDL